jgi:hypothetical protein
MERIELSLAAWKAAVLTDTPHAREKLRGAATDAPIPITSKEGYMIPSPERSACREGSAASGMRARPRSAGVDPVRPRGRRRRAVPQRGDGRRGACCGRRGHAEGVGAVVPTYWQSTIAVAHHLVSMHAWLPIAHASGTVASGARG